MSDQEAQKQNQVVDYHFFSHNLAEVIQRVGKKTLIANLSQMLQIRNFEVRAESAYLHGFIGGFFHSYSGQEAIQVAGVQVFGKNNWYITTYRCHALALLLGAGEKEVMAELFGKATGNAKGRGGSMHLYTEQLLGGFGIVGGHIPIAVGSAFALKYRGIRDRAAICYLGDGAVAQGAFHEALNLASLWNLPCIFIIENNQWGMGTSVESAICVKRLAEDKASGYNMKAYTLDGMDYFNCYAGFFHIYKEVLQTQRPVLVEVVTERFRGHSISDPGLYRSKENLKLAMKRDPLLIMRETLIKERIITEQEYKEMDDKMREVAIEAVEYAKKSPWPDPITLEEGVFAP